MKRFFITFMFSLLSVSLTSCDNTPTSNNNSNNKTIPASIKPVDSSKTVSVTNKGTFKVFQDGILVIDGFNPIVEFSTTDKKFTFYSTKYSAELMNKYSYATFELTLLTNNEIKEGVDISTDPNTNISVKISLIQSDSPNKAKTSFYLNNGGKNNLTLQKFSSSLKGTITYSTTSVSDIIKDYANHDLSINFEFPYENGKLKTSDADSIEMKDGIAYYGKK